MKNDVKVQNVTSPININWSRGAVAALAIVMVVSLSSCSTLKGSKEGTWNTSYFTDPDRVWGAIQLALIDLDYEVESENREDGIIRATSEPSEDGTVISLAIDQVMRTEDQVHVYVKPSFVGDGGSTNPDLLRAAADELIKAMDDRLRG